MEAAWEVPAPLRERVAGALEDARAEPSPARRASILARAGAELLEAAAPEAGVRSRAVAFDLLAADALLTLACETATAAEEPEEAMSGVLRSLGEREA